MEPQFIALPAQPTGPIEAYMVPQGGTPNLAQLPRTISEAIHYVMSASCVEPVQRVKDIDHVPRGYRDLPVRPRFIGHRFAIKGGISRRQVFAMNVTKDNALFRALLDRHA